MKEDNISLSELLAIAIISILLFFIIPEYYAIQIHSTIFGFALILAIFKLELEG